MQALLQAEARISQLDGIGLVLFLRTDPFELYDIQEKNKLVSRSLVLERSEEDWLRMLVRRVFANEPFARLATRLHVAGEDAEVRAALEVLFADKSRASPSTGGSSTRSVTATATSPHAWRCYCCT